MRFLVKLVQACVSTNTPLIIENPRSSMLWLAPPLAKELSHWSVAFSTCDQCQYGAAWMKATKLAAVGLPPTCRNPLEKRCHGRAICSATSRPHIVLTGLVEGGKQFRTAQAQVYPHRFASSVADALVTAFEQKCLLRLKQACG